MGAPAEQADLETVRRRGDHAAASADDPGRSNHDVLPEHDVGLGEAPEQSIVDHRLRAFARLFGGLKHRHHGASPARAGLRRSRRT